MNHPMQKMFAHYESSSVENKNERVKENEKFSFLIYNHSFLSKEGTGIE